MILEGFSEQNTSMILWAAEGVLHWPAGGLTWGEEQMGDPVLPQNLELCAHPVVLGPS